MDIAAMSMRMNSVQIAQQTNVAVMKLAMDAVSGAQSNMLEELMGPESMDILNEMIPAGEMTSGINLDTYV